MLWLGNISGIFSIIVCAKRSYNSKQIHRQSFYAFFENLKEWKRRFQTLVSWCSETSPWLWPCEITPCDNEIVWGHSLYVTVLNEWFHWTLSLRTDDTPFDGVLVENCFKERNLWLWKSSATASHMLGEGCKGCRQHVWRFLLERTVSGNPEWRLRFMLAVSLSNGYTP